MKRKKKIEAVQVWGYELDGNLDQPIVLYRPHSFAKYIRVVIVRQSDWRAIQKQLKSKSR